MPSVRNTIKLKKHQIKKGNHIYKLLMMQLYAGSASQYYSLSQCLIHPRKIVSLYNSVMMIPEHNFAITMLLLYGIRGKIKILSSAARAMWKILQQYGNATRVAQNLVCVPLMQVMLIISQCCSPSKRFDQF